MPPERLIYVANSKIPSRHANAVQVVQMICALAPLVNRLHIHLPGGISRDVRLWTKTLFSPYGLTVPNNAKVFLLSKRRDFETHISQTLQLNPGDTVFTRSVQLASDLTKQGFSVLFESHVFSSDERKTQLTEFIDTINHSRSSGIIAISREIVDAYIERGLDPAKILAAPDGVNFEMFNSQKRGGLGRLFGKQIYCKPIIAYAGSLKEEKGASLLARVAGNLPDVHFAIIGGSRQEAAALAQTGRKHPNLFVHQSVPHKTIPCLLQDATALVMPYLPTGALVPYMSPLKLFEYLATGKPIISANLPVLQPFLRHGENCLLFKPGSQDALTAQIQTILNMKKSVFLENQLTTARQYSWSHRARTILKWHHELSGRGRTE